MFAFHSFQCKDTICLWQIVSLHWKETDNSIMSSTCMYMRKRERESLKEMCFTLSIAVERVNSFHCSGKRIRERAWRLCEKLHTYYMNITWVLHTYYMSITWGWCTEHFYPLSLEPMCLITPILVFSWWVTIYNGVKKFIQLQN